MSQFRSLVFEGGGVKGIAYAGAFEELERRGITKEIRRVAGTSAGAISAGLVALGADSAFIARAVGGTEFRTFMDSSFGALRDLNRLVGDYGWFKGDRFSEWMREQTKALTGDPEFTFGQLWKAVESKQRPAFKKLYVVGSNLSTKRPAYFSNDTPDTPIWYGIRVSMSIPLFFAAVKDGADILVDGGVTYNYPLDLFDDRRFLSDPAHGVTPAYDSIFNDDHVYNRETLGLRVDTKDQIKAEKESWSAPPSPIHNFPDYVAALVGFMGDLANRQHLHKNDWHRTIYIDASGVGTTEFNISNAKTQMLLENGRRGVREYFQWFDDPNADPKPINRV